MKLEKITAKGASNLFRNPQSDIIYFRKYIKGKEITRSTKTTKLEKAKAFVEELLRDGKPAKKEVKRTALELFETWIASKKTLGARANTITSIEATKRYVEPFFVGMMPSQITSDWWTGEYIPQVREKTHANRKFFNDKKWLSAFTKHLHAEGIIAKRPKLQNPDKKTAVGKVFTDDEIENLLNFAQNPDLHLAITMAVTMGMRRNEIFALRLTQIDRAKRTISLTEDDTKTKKARKFKVSAAAWPAIEARLAAGGVWLFPSKADPTKPLHKDGFKTAWTNLKKICDVTGRFHDLRHTFLTKAFKALGANPALICHYAGLSLEVAEKIYLHFDEEDTAAVASLVDFDVRGKSGENGASNA